LNPKSPLRTFDFVIINFESNRLQANNIKNTDKKIE
jgi:hypothetical protein